MTRWSSLRFTASTPRQGEHNLAKPNFGYQKRQKELEKKRKKEEKMKKKLEKNAAPAAEAPPRLRRKARSPFDVRRRGNSGWRASRRSALTYRRRGSWPPTFSRSIPRSGTGRSLPADIRKLARRGHLDTTWSCGRHRNIEPGSRAFLVRLGVAPEGIFGSGVTLTAPETRPHWMEEKAAAGITYQPHDAAARASVRRCRSSRSTS